MTNVAQQVVDAALGYVEDNDISKVIGTLLACVAELDARVAKLEYEKFAECKSPQVSGA